MMIKKTYISTDLPRLSKIHQHIIKVQCFGTTPVLWSLCHIITQSGRQVINISEQPVCSIFRIENPYAKLHLLQIPHTLPNLTYCT